MNSKKIKVLFICTHNRCRSILAEAITANLAENNIKVKSAGSSPADHIHPQTILNLKRHGYEIDRLFSKSWNDISAFKPDICITVCDNAANETCPLWFGNTIKVHWGMKDPSLSGPNQPHINVAYDKTIDILENRIKFINQYNLIDIPKTELEKIFHRAGEIM